VPQVTKAKLAARMVEIGGGSLKDAWKKPVATNATIAPRSSEALTREWLTGALCRSEPEAQVVDFTLGEIDHGSNARQAVSVRYNEAGEQAGLPRTMFAKSTPKFTQRLAGGLTGAAVSETGFYSQLRPELGDIEAPTAYYGVADPRFCRSLLLMEDISDRVQAFGDPSVHYIDRDKAESMVKLLASVHGSMWESPLLRQFPWLRTTQEFQDHLNGTVGFKARTLVGIDRAREKGLAPEGFLRRRDDVHSALQRSMLLNVQAPQTLIHFDVHLANWYITKDERMGLMDWGCVVKGQWAIDFAYAVMAALTVEDRRAWERELLELYLSELANAAGKPPAFDVAWLKYRQQTFHGLTFWLYTIGYGRMQPKMQPDAVCEAIVTRTTHAVDDLRSFEALDER
jgi:Phosphotransferase enzyme family